MDKFDLNSIKGILRDIGRQILGFLKIIITLPYFKIYLLVSVVLTLMFIVLTFPYDELFKNKIKSLEGGIVKSIDIANMDFGIIGTSSAEGIEIIPSYGREVHIDSVLLDDNFNLYSILFSRHFLGSLQLKGFSCKTDSVDVTCDINCNYNVSFNELNLAGINTASIKTIIENSKLVLSNITLPDNMGGLPINIPPMNFSSVIIHTVIKNGVLQFEQFKVSGNDLRGSISGSITLSRVYINSKLDITISIDSDSSVLEPYRDFLSSYINVDGDIVLPFTGTIMRPRLEKKEIQGIPSED